MRLNPFTLYPRSLEDALRNLLAEEHLPSKATSAKGHQERQGTTTKAYTAKAKGHRKQ